MRISRTYRAPILVSFITALTFACSILVNEAPAQRSSTRTTDQRISTSKKDEVGGGTVCPAGIRRWDGEGTTNNWSEAANWCDNTVPPGGSTIVFDFTSTKNATIDVNVTATVFNLNTGYTGTVTMGPGVNVTTTTMTVSQGTFTGGSGTLDVNHRTNIIGTAVFNAPTGNYNIGAEFAYAPTSGAMFNANGGTVNFDGSSTTVDISGAVTFNNLNINLASDSSPVFVPTSLVASVLGTLTLSNGKIETGTVAAYGTVNYQTTFDGGFGFLYFYGTATRNIALPAGVPMPRLIGLDAPNTTVDVVGSGSTSLAFRLDVGSGTFNTNNSNVIAQNVLVYGGVLNIGSGTSLTSAGTVTITAGLLNAIDASFVRFRAVNIIGAGILNGPSTTMYLNGFFNIDESGGADFYHNNGTAFFEGDNCGVAVDNATAGTTRFFTLIVDLPQNSSIFSFDVNGGVDSAIVEGNTFLTNGIFSSGTLFTRRSVTVASTFDGGIGSLYFDGDLIQNFINEGGVNPTGTFTVDKSPGTFVLATGSFLLSTGTAVIVSRGGLKMAAGVDVTIGSLITGVNGYFIVNSPSNVTLGGSVTNNGRIDLRHAGASCPSGNDLVRLRSSSMGSQRSWAGNGASLMIGLDVQDMGGTQQIVVWYGVSSGNNAANWSFFGTCPPAVHVNVGGRAITPDGTGIQKARVTLTDAFGNTRHALTNQFGYFQFQDVRANDGYVIEIDHKSYQFTNGSRLISPSSDINDLMFSGTPIDSSN